MIKEQAILDFQNSWGSGVVEIGKLKGSPECSDVARDFVSRFYAYDRGEVLFKPTKVGREQFRSTLESAVSYFIGANENFPEDRGFALNPWQNIRFENDKISILDEICLCMGNYFFMDQSGKEAKVEYSMAIDLRQVEDLRLVLHHSSLPFSK